MFLLDLISRTDIDIKTKKFWKKKFIYMFILVNSFYYDSKYEKKDKQFFLEQFIKKSRDKFIGSFYP